MLQPEFDLRMTENTMLQPGTYWLPQAITIEADNVVLDGNGAVLIGSGAGSGVVVNGRSGVTIKNLHLQNYHHAISATHCIDLSVVNCQTRATNEVAANTIFLDIWKTADSAYGGGIFLHQVQKSTIQHNDLQHQMNGLLAYDCQHLTVSDNNASYCSGFGFYLSATSDSRFLNNYADYCCRYHPRGDMVGHMGADAAGFVIVRGSCRNLFQRNLARLGGDGFFLAGLTPQYEHLGCNDNVFEENDGSYSPNIAFEGTFSQGNIYRRNKANHCNYGFWLGFSANCKLEGNQLFHNRQAGIAVENGYGMQAVQNDFRYNQHGVLLWSKYVAGFAQAVPQNDTSRDWQIEHNRFWHNNKAIRIAANQDHGIRSLPQSDKLPPLPRNHQIRHNKIEGNRIGVELEAAVDTTLAQNEWKGNVAGNMMTKA